MHIERLNNLINAYALESGLGKFAPSKQGTYRLSFKNDLVVNIDALGDSGTVLVYAELGPAPERAEACQTLLKANFPGYATRHNTLAIDKQKNTVVLLRSLPERDMDIAAFKKLLNDFVGALSEWRQKLLDGDLSHGGDADNKRSETPANHFIRG